MSEKKERKRTAMEGNCQTAGWFLQIRHGIEKDLDHFRTVAKLSPGGEETETHQSHRIVTRS